MRYRKFIADDLRRIEPWDHWEHRPELRDPTFARMMADTIAAGAGFAWTALLENGHIAAIWGAALQASDRACCWGLFDRALPKTAWSGLTRAGIASFDYLQRRGLQLEILVRDGFANGHRYAALLGFTPAADRIAAYGAAGAGHALYARPRPSHPGRNLPWVG